MKFIGFYNICELLSFTCRFFVCFFFCKSWALLKFVFLNDFGVFMLMISMRVLRKTWNWKKKLMKIITSKFKKSYIVSNIVNNFTCKQEIRGKFLCNGRWWWLVWVWIFIFSFVMLSWMLGSMKGSKWSNVRSIPGRTS